MSLDAGAGPSSRDPRPKYAAADLRAFHELAARMRAELESDILPY